MQGNRAILSCHELKQLYYVELDAYDYTNTEMQEQYRVDYVPDGWGYSKIIHNGKTYKLHKI